MGRTDLLLSAMNFKRLSGFLINPPKLAKFVKTMIYDVRYKDFTDEEIQAIHQDTLTNFAGVIDLISQKAPTPACHLDYSAREATEPVDVAELGALLGKHGSDKTTKHNYHQIYGRILSKIRSSPDTRLLEIGLGTNNIDVLSNMGEKGKPGASLRAFRDFMPNARIYGADIDKRILFTEDRIKTFYVDQTKWSTFQDLEKSLSPEKFDVVIDDGFHMAHANLLTLKFGLGMIKPDGVVIIEDIAFRDVYMWELLSSYLEQNGYKSYIAKTLNSAYVVVICRNTCQLDL